MIDIPEFYITGLPIETPIGTYRPLKVKDYPDFFVDLQIVGLTKNHIINRYSQLNRDGTFDRILEYLDKASLYTISHELPEVNESYIRLFHKLFNEDVFEKISEEEFFYYRKLILQTNGLKEEVINPNPEIQRVIERSKRVKSQDGEKIDFAAMMTSIVTSTGLSFSEINEFTMYQFYMTYHRVALFKNYDTSTLFATVSTEKVKIESWSKTIDLFEEEKHYFTESEFKKDTGSLFNE